MKKINKYPNRNRNIYDLKTLKKVKERHKYLRKMFKDRSKK